MIVICGPTATGKTDLGITLAKQFFGELISADSRQVYKGMDIVTGKDIPADSPFQPQHKQIDVANKEISVGFRVKDGVPIWLVDAVTPDYIFNVGEYKEIAEKVINNCIGRGFLPIIVGGSGLYVKALTTELDLLVIPPNKAFRRVLSKKSIPELCERLMKINPEKMKNMNESDRQNPRRLIRAIEVSIILKKKNVSSAAFAQKTKDDILFIGLDAPRIELYKRIKRRVEERVKNGALDEASALFQKGYGWNLPSISASGYKPLHFYLQGAISLEKATACWRRLEHGYARRQIAWFKRDKRIHWFDITDKDYMEKVVDMVKKWYTFDNAYQG